MHPLEHLGSGLDARRALDRVRCRQRAHRSDRSSRNEGRAAEEARRTRRGPCGSALHDHTHLLVARPRTDYAAQAGAVKVVNRSLTGRCGAFELPGDQSHSAGTPQPSPCSATRRISRMGGRPADPGGDEGSHGQRHLGRRSNPQRRRAALSCGCECAPAQACGSGAGSGPGRATAGRQRESQRRRQVRPAWARTGSAKVASHSSGPRFEVTTMEPERCRSVKIS